MKKFWIVSAEQVLHFYVLQGLKKNIIKVKKTLSVFVSL